MKQKLRNRLVAGVRSDAIRQALIREGPGLTFDAAVTLATQMDDYQSSAMAQQQSTAASLEVTAISAFHNKKEGPKAQRSQVSPNHSAPNLGPPSTKAKYTSRTKCWRCGRSHQPDVCRFRDATCHSCGSIGHIRPICNKRGGQLSTKVVEGLPNENEEAYNSNFVADTLVVSKSDMNNPYVLTTVLLCLWKLILVLVFP